MQHVRFQSRRGKHLAIALMLLPALAACDTIPPGTTTTGGVIAGGPGGLLDTASVNNAPVVHPYIHVDPTRDGRRVVTLSSPEANEVVQIAVLSNGDELEPFAMTSNGDEEVITDLAEGTYQLEIRWNSNAVAQGEVSLSGTTLALSETFEHRNGDVVALRFG